MKNTTTLTLIVNKKWFDLIQSWQKKEDYREIKPYWVKRLQNTNGIFKHFDFIKIANWYKKNRPEIIFKFNSIRITEWNEKTDLWTGSFFAVWLGDRL
jgi:hypothetical protein